MHLVLPPESLFSEQEREAKASVVIKLRGGHLSDDSLEAITHLVASAVDNLKPENVTLIDAEGGAPILARAGRTGRPRAWTEMEVALSQRIVATLEPVVGPGKARANVNVEYDSAASDSMQESYDPNGSVILTSQTSTEHVAEAGAEGTPGTTSNVPGKQPAPPPKPAAPADSESQGLQTESKTFAVSKTVRHVVQPAGNLKRITAAVLVDDATDITDQNGQKVETRRKRSPEEMKQIADLVAAAIGIDATRGDKVAVENLSFQGLPFESPRPPTLSDRALPIVQKWINLIRYGALIILFFLVYLLVLRPIKRQIVTTFEELPKQIVAAKDSLSAALNAAPGSAAPKPDDTASIEASLQQLGEFVEHFACSFHPSVICEQA